LENERLNRAGGDTYGKKKLMTKSSTIYFKKDIGVNCQYLFLIGVLIPISIYYSKLYQIYVFMKIDFRDLTAEDVAELIVTEFSLLMKEM